MTARHPASSGAHGGRRPLSLRSRFGAVAVLVLAISLGLVGLALDAAFQRSSVTELRDQMETWVYLTLGAAEVGAGGTLQVPDDLGDPRLGQPGSGIYAHVHGAGDHWSSRSALGLKIPELDLRPAGQSWFGQLSGRPAYYAYQYGVAWELADGTTLPFTVTILADPVWLEPRLTAFRGGLWRSLGAAGVILAAAQLLLFTLGMRPLTRVARDVARIESGQRDALAGPYPRELEPLTSNLDRLLATEKANQARYRNALDSLAHSLKTPLAVIRSGLARDGGGGDPSLLGAVDDMQGLITSRLQRAAASTRRALAAPVPVAAEAERIVESLRKVHSQKMRRIDVIIPERLVFFGEQRDLLEIMGNLMDNACKYGDGEARLSAGLLDGGGTRTGLWIKVENDGLPIAPGQAQVLLRRGMRGDERVEGHGLGLTIVKEVVSAYGGTMKIGTSELGGAAFTVSIPPS